MIKCSCKTVMLRLEWFSRSIGPKNVIGIDYIFVQFIKTHMDIFRVL